MQIGNDKRGCRELARDPAKVGAPEPITSHIATYEDRRTFSAGSVITPDHCSLPPLT